MTLNQRLRIPALVLVSAALIAGCDSGPKLVPVTGKVTLDGKPLDGANIAFAPEPGNAVPIQGLDVTGAEGNYTLMANGRRGVPPGKYKVVISKVEAKSGVVIPDEFKKDPMMAKMAGMTKETLPDSVSGVGESQFDREVPPEGGTFDFDVKATKAKAKGK
jgi:hypothetical protein